MRMSPLKKIIIISLVSSAAIAGLLFILIIISGNVQNYRDTLAATDAKIATGEKDFDRLAKISDLLKNRQADIGRLQAITIDRQRPLVFIEAIEQIAHVTNTKIALAVNETKASADSLSFGATLEGSEKNVRTMLALIQTLPYQITIDNISFQRDIPNTSGAGQGPLLPITRIILAIRVKTQQ